MIINRFADTERASYNVGARQLANRNSEWYEITVEMINDDGVATTLIDGKRSKGHRRTADRLDRLFELAAVDDVESIAAEAKSWSS